ncbi:MAG: hypothetical protein J3Q66DRAFT_340532 [Benniella sp.]|nr:MAG: hypothetical protein J3Q66DRAFT_340532 [Benniella sp.]
MSSTPTTDPTETTFKSDIEKITLEDIQSIPHLSFLGFTELVCKNFGKYGRLKSTVNDRYLELATEASKSEDEKTAEDGKKMFELFKTELEQVEAFWNQPALVRDHEAAKKTRLYVLLSDVVGPGTRSCDLHLEPLVINGRSISKELMDARKSFFDGKSDLETMDDLLVLNFIFTEKFLREHFTEDIVSELVPKRTIPPLSAADEQFVTSMVKLAKNKDGAEVRRSAMERLMKEMDNPLANLFNGWCMNRSMWQYKVDGKGGEGFKKVNTATFMWHYVNPILDAIFGRLRMTQGRGATLTLPKKYRRDFYMLPMFGGYHHVTIMMMRMTKRDVKERHRGKVERELLFSMKVSLDLLMKSKVKDPEVVGLLVRDSRIEVLTLRIQHEAMYIPRLLGIMEIPKDHTDFGCLLEGLPVVLAARGVVIRTLKAVKASVSKKDPDLSVLEDDSEHPLCRPSFYIED